MIFKIARFMETVKVTDRTTDYVLLDASTEEEALAFAKEHENLLPWFGEWQADMRKERYNDGDETTSFGMDEGYDDASELEGDEDLEDEEVISATAETSSQLKAADDEARKKREEKWAAENMKSDKPLSLVDVGRSSSVLKRIFRGAWVLAANAFVAWAMFTRLRSVGFPALDFQFVSSGNSDPPDSGNSEPSNKRAKR